jgi:hypothetical protein
MIQSSDKADAKEISPPSVVASAPSSSNIQPIPESESTLTRVSTGSSDWHELSASNGEAVRASIESGEPVADNKVGTESTISIASQVEVADTSKVTQEHSVKQNINSLDQRKSSWDLLSVKEAANQILTSAFEITVPVVGFVSMAFGMANLGLFAVSWTANEALAAWGLESPYFLQSLVTTSFLYAVPPLMLGLFCYAVWTDYENTKNG